jgi:hypothetical protein
MRSAVLVRSAPRATEHLFSNRAATIGATEMQMQVLAKTSGKPLDMVNKAARSHSLGSHVRSMLSSNFGVATRQLGT